MTRWWTRTLGAADAAALRRFQCTVGRSVQWEKSVQETIHRMADLLEGPDGSAAPVVVGAGAAGTVRIDGVAVFHRRRGEDIDEPVLHVDVLAVRVGLKRHGLGTWLKREILDYAWANGVSVVSSHVHESNAGMFRINSRFGAETARLLTDPLGQNPYWLCTIRRPPDA